jgi:hypothetical protein
MNEIFNFSRCFLLLLLLLLHFQQLWLLVFRV